ncbi:dienelactone hydrolase family protein [Lacibacterium aquatile]|uniref:Dienelactone hydrolase family protein n=1 Tax=Lacibacterium aquatile TaxID=1168082 RepID=A0ABW5DSJ8_9PROT
MSELRAALKSLLRSWSDERPAPRVLSRREETRGAMAVEHLLLDLGTGEPVPAVLTRPTTPGPHPAVLYCHAHGARYAIGLRELLEGRPSLLSPYGPLLAEMGFVSLCVEMPTFGARQEPAEGPLSKALLWRGETLFGLMLRELAGGVDYLVARPDVDAARIATFGLSMGATQAFWLAALDERIAAAAHLCCYTDLASLVATGAHDLHGHYMTVPGLLALTSTGAIAGLVAPRPQLICIGYDDPLTPRGAVEKALRETGDAYGTSQALVFHGEEGVGHRETEVMRERVIEFLTRLK